MKFLNDKDYNALKEKADAFDAVVKSVTDNGENISANDISADTIIEAMQHNTDQSDSAELQTQLDAANARITELETELETANSRVSELESELNEIPAQQAATIVAKGEPDGKNKDIATFATENRGNTSVIIEKAKEEGLI